MDLAWWAVGNYPMVVVGCCLVCGRSAALSECVCVCVFSGPVGEWVAWRFQRVVEWCVGGYVMGWCDA